MIFSSYRVITRCVITLAHNIILLDFRCCRNAAFRKCGNCWINRLVFLSGSLGFFRSIIIVLRCRTSRTCRAISVHFPFFLCRFRWGRGGVMRRPFGIHPFVIFFGKACGWAETEAQACSHECNFDERWCHNNQVLIVIISWIEWGEIELLIASVFYMIWIVLQRKKINCPKM